MTKGRCPSCGVNMALTGRVHRCVSRPVPPPKRRSRKKPGTERKKKAAT